ncbi:MAG TPA: IPT/TIG domain-containing protein [Acidimicrobiales bacterium]|nr:IPT/TIG domain-containing protein [Acidimicrobiales bacterium]
MTGQSWGGSSGAPESWDPAAASRRAIATRRVQARWRVGLAALAVVVVALAAVTVGVAIGHLHGTTGSTRAGSSTQTTAGSDNQAQGPGAPGTPGGPTISALSPAAGAPGQIVVITGTGLVSANGQVLASFGSVVAPTSCPSATTCRATAPAGSGRVQVTVATASGTSNGLWFTYQ